MKIASASLAMQSQHYAASHEKISMRLASWVGRERPDFEGTQRAQPSPPAAPPVQISDAGQSAQAAEANAIDQAQDAVDNDPIVMLIRAMVEWLTGEAVKVFNASQMQTDANPPLPPADTNAAASPAAPETQSAGYGIEYDYHVLREESEQTRFSAQGTVKTTDGREIAFNLGLSMSRSYVERTDITIRAGDAVRKDPLVINFNGTAAQLSDQRFRFDLNSNGQAVDIPLLGGNSGYLALDLNANDKVDSGTELFGPTSGSGFAELAKYDLDHNGWIDENDAVFTQLRVWTPAAEGGGKLATLKGYDVGALHLGYTATPFALRGANNQDLGLVRDSGIYLTESGHAGSLQEIDLTA